MINEQDSLHSTHTFFPKRLSWSAIFFGALIALGLGFLLNLLGCAIGLSLFNLSNEGDIVISIGGLIGIITGLISSMILAGYATGYLSREYHPQRNLGIMYGFAT